MAHSRILSASGILGGMAVVVALAVSTLNARGQLAQAQQVAAPIAVAGGAVALVSHSHAVVPQLPGTGLEAIRGAAGQTEVGDPTEVDSEPQWLNGQLQVIYDNDCFDQTIIPITSQFVSYWGSRDGASPKVGEVFYGRVAVAGAGLACSGPYAHIEVIPPAGVHVAISKANKVYCSAGNVHDPKLTELPASECPQSTFKGAFGWVFDRPNGLPWEVNNGRMVVVSVPLVASKVMSSTQADSVLTGGVHAFDGWLSPWGAPKINLSVADNPPSIQYDGAVTTSKSGTRTSATVLSHYKAGKAYFDLGATTKYGVVSDAIEIGDKTDAYRVYEVWQGLEPEQTYHWRVRFVTADGKTYAGADQIFSTRDGQPTPKPTATSR